jgi:chemotaxis protein CheX
MTPIEEQITALAGDIWLAVLGLPLVPSPSGVSKAPAQGVLTGSVAISGAWQGVVVLQCSTAFAQRAASVMFGLEPEYVGREEELDALGELANMVSGNLKALLPGPSRLCLPIVAEGPGDLSVSAADVASQVRLDCDDDAIVVSLVSTRPPHPAS